MRRTPFFDHGNGLGIIFLRLTVRIRSRNQSRNSPSLRALNLRTAYCRPPVFRMKSLTYRVMRLLAVYGTIPDAVTTSETCSGATLSSYHSPCGLSFSPQYWPFMNCIRSCEMAQHCTFPTWPGQDRTGRILAFNIVRLSSPSLDLRAIVWVAYLATGSSTCSDSQAYYRPTQVTMATLGSRLSRSATYRPIYESIP